MVAAACIDGSQRLGRFSGENEREQTSFGHRPEVLSQWSEYNNLNKCIQIKYPWVNNYLYNTKNRICGQSKLKTAVKLVKYRFLMYINHMSLIGELLFKALITHNTMKLRFKSTFIF